MLSSSIMITSINDDASSIMITCIHYYASSNKITSIDDDDSIKITSS